MDRQGSFVMTTTKLLVLVVGVGLWLTACKMGPDYARPETPTTEGWRLAPATSESLANLPWWELLKDQELQKLIRASLEENLDLRIATANINAYQAQLAIAKFDLAPQLHYTAGGFYYRNTNNAISIGDAAIIPGPTSDSDGLTLANERGNVGLKWEVDLWGRIRRSIEATRAQLLSKVENQRAVVLGLVSNVAQAYFDLRGLDLQIDITKRTLKTWEESVRLSALRYRHGDVSKLDLDRFEAERAGTAAQLADLEREVVQKENQISLLLGRRPMSISRGLTLVEQPMPPQVPPGLPSDLLERRPDIMQAEQDLTSATASIGVAQAQRFPSFALTGAVGGASVQLNSLSLGPFATFSAGANLAGPLLSASALGYQVDVTEAQANAAMSQYKKTILTAFKEVEDALIAVQKAAEQRTALEQQITALKSSLSLADLRYQGGRATYLEVLTAQRSLFESEIALARVRRNQLNSVVQLYKALGGGWQAADPASTARNGSSNGQVAQKAAN